MEPIYFPAAPPLASRVGSFCSVSYPARRHDRGRGKSGISRAVEIMTDGAGGMDHDGRETDAA